MPRVRPASVLGAVLLLVVLVGIAVRLMGPAGGKEPPTPVPVALETSSSAPVIEAPSGPVGLPTDPLPEPLQLPGDPDRVASLLAPIVAAGGPSALPALLAALQKSGITVYGPDEAVAVAAEGPDQGLYFESWEVRAMLGVIGRKHASVPLTSFAAGLASDLPELRDQHADRLLADDIIAHANAPDAPIHFWARFIVELGKQPHRHQPYDLLGQADVASVNLDAIQLSMITQRLAADLTTAAGGARAAHNFFSLPPVYAAEPCASSPSRPAAKVSQSVFGSLLSAVGRNVLEARDRVRRSMENFRNYRDLLFLLNALKVDVEMEDGPPLKRTKTTSAGEERKIKTTVSIGGTVLEWDTCLGNAMRIGQPGGSSWYRPGPVPDVPVDWDLDGRGIVRIPMSAPAAERGLPDATKTDARGVARLAVEGAPQVRNLRSTARERRRTAAAAASVKVKFADLVHRVAGADNSLASGLNNWVFDQEITIDVPYPFEVIDWSDGAGQWTGTITVVDTAISGFSGRGAFNQGATQSQETETKQIEVTLMETLSEHGDGGSLAASVKGRIKGTYTRLKTHASWTKESCGATKGRVMNNTSRESTTGTGQDEATISVTVFADGTYLVGAASEMQIEATPQFSAELEAFGAGCAVVTKTSANELVKLTHALGGMIQVTGKVDPNDPDVLSGSTTVDQSPRVVSDGATSRIFRTTTWNLRRIR